MGCKLSPKLQPHNHKVFVVLQTDFVNDIYNMKSDKEIIKEFETNYSFCLFGQQ